MPMVPASIVGRLSFLKPVGTLQSHFEGYVFLVLQVSRRVVILGNLGTEISESTSQANIVAEKIRTLLKSPYLLKIETADKVSKLIEHHCTSSIGVALFLDHEVSTDEVIKWADMAMYKAKESGGNSIHFYGLETAS